MAISIYPNMLRIFVDILQEMNIDADWCNFHAIGWIQGSSTKPFQLPTGHVFFPPQCGVSSGRWGDTVAGEMSRWKSIGGSGTFFFNNDLGGHKVNKGIFFFLVVCIIKTLLYIYIEHPYWFDIGYNIL